MAPTLLFKRLKSAAAADALAASCNNSNEVLSSETTMPIVAGTTLSASALTSSSRNEKMTKSPGGGLSPASTKQTATQTLEALNETMDVTSDESEFNDSNDTHGNAVDGDIADYSNSCEEEQGGGGIDKEHVEEEEEEEEEDSRYMSVDSYCPPPSELIGNTAVHQDDDISQLRFGESVSVCGHSAIVHGGIGGGGGGAAAFRPMRSEVELDAFMPMPTSVQGGIGKDAQIILHEVDEEGIEDVDGVAGAEDEKLDGIVDATESGTKELYSGKKGPKSTTARAEELYSGKKGPKSTTARADVSPQPLPPAPSLPHPLDINRKFRSGRSFRRKNKDKRQARPTENEAFLARCQHGAPAARSHHGSNTDAAGATLIARTTSSQRVAANSFPPGISLSATSSSKASRPEVDGKGGMGYLIISDLAAAAAEYAIARKNVGNARDSGAATNAPTFLFGASDLQSSPIDATEKTHEGEYGGGDRTVGHKRDERKIKNKKKDRGSSENTGGGQDGNTPTPPYNSTPSFDSDHIKDYELDPAVDYLSLVLPLSKLATEPPLFPNSGATIFPVGSSDCEESSVRTDARSVLTHQGTSAADRMAETIRCANKHTDAHTDATISTIDGRIRIMSPHTLDTADEAETRMNEARELGTVQTIDEDDNIYRPLGPVDVDNAKFVGGEDEQERHRDEDHIQSIPNDLWEAAARAQQYVREGRYGNAARVYNALLSLHCEQYGSSHPLAASGHHNLSVVLTLSGKYSEAQPHCAEALRIRRMAASKPNSTTHDKLSVATTLIELGMIYYAIDEFSRALKSLREALQIACSTLGYDNAMVSRVLNTIGCVHYETGKLAASQTTFSESLDIQRSFMGNNASGGDAEQALLNNATTLCNAGMVSIKRRQYDASISLLEEGIMVISSVLGDGHPMATNSAAILELLVNLRGGSSDREVVSGGSGANVEPLRVVEVLGLSPSRISAGRVESVGSRQGAILERAASEENGLFGGNSDGIPKRKFVTVGDGGFDSSDRVELGPLRHEMSPQQRIRQTVLSSLMTSSRLKDSVGENAIPHILPFSPSDTIKSGRTRGRIPCDIDEEGIIDAELHLKSIYDQALEHLKHEEYDEAIDLFTSALRSHAAKYGETNHLVGTAFHNIGIIELHAERYDEALASFHQAVNVRAASLGPEHPDVTASLMKLCLVLVALNEHDSALLTLNSVLKVQRATLGSNHSQVGRVLSNIGCIHYELGDLSSSKIALEEAIEIDRAYCRNNGDSAVGKLTLASTLCNEGFVHQMSKDRASAIVAYEEALQIQRDILGPKNKSTEGTLECLAVVMAAANWQDGDADDIEIGGNAKDQMIKTYIDMLCEG